MYSDLCREKKYKKYIYIYRCIFLNKKNLKMKRSFSLLEIKKKK